MNLGGNTSKQHKSQAPIHVSAAVVTISDSKFEYLIKKSNNNDNISMGKTEDSSGKFIKDEILKGGHKLLVHAQIPDHSGLIIEMIKYIGAEYSPDCIITTGGTGISKKDVTIETMESIYEKKLNGFGEFFRRESYDEIGSSAMLSRASAGVYDNMLIFSLPGSPNACKVGMKLILKELGHLVKHLKE